MRPWLCLNPRTEPLGGLLGGDLTRIDENDGKLLAPIARHEIRVPSSGGQQTPHLLQDFIACLMTMDVVEALEVIHIEHYQGKG